MKNLLEIFEKFSVRHWLLLVLFVLLVAANLTLELSGVSIYESYLREASWLVVAIVYLFAVGRPFARLTADDDGAIRQQILIGLITIFAAFAIAVFVLGEADAEEFAFSLAASLLAAALVGLGWYFHYRVSTKASRKAHTINLLMASRLSEEFQQHLRNIRSAYDLGTPVPKADAERYYSSVNPRLVENEQEAIKCQAIYSIKYILNYYEFLAVAIRKNDVDEDLLYQCLSGIALALHETFSEVIQVAQESQDLAYEHFELLINGEEGRKGWRQRLRAEVAEKEA